MTDKEKARKISEKYEDWWAVEAPDVRGASFESAMAMAKWKEQQMIDKACEWWENELTYPTMSQVEIDWMQTKIVAFRKAMEE